jgi:hypothetical protein
MLNNHTGGSNIAIGVQALANNDSGSGNIVLGNVSGTAITTASNVICIGNLSADNVGNHTYIGNINSTTVSGGGTDTVTVDLTTGLLGHLSSSRRYKEEIQPMDSASETLYQLKPVTYRYKKEIDASQSLDYGLVAEDVLRSILVWQSAMREVELRACATQQSTLCCSTNSSKSTGKCRICKPQLRSSKKESRFSRRNWKSRQRKSRK